MMSSLPNFAAEQRPFDRCRATFIPFWRRPTGAEPVSSSSHSGSMKFATATAQTIHQWPRDVATNTLTNRHLPHMS